MAALNNDPIYTGTPDIQGNLIVTAPTVVYNISGTIGTDIYKLFQASTNGGYVSEVRFKYAANGTTASNNCAIKLWLSSVASGTPILGTTAWLIDSIVLPTTGTMSTTTSEATYRIPLGFALPASYTILAVITVSQPANCGWIGTVIGGKY